MYFFSPTDFSELTIRTPASLLVLRITDWVFEFVSSVLSSYSNKLQDAFRLQEFYAGPESILVLKHICFQKSLHMVGHLELAFITAKEVTEYYLTL